MLSKEENELLTRVGPGTPMGRLFRSYWIPVLLAEELPEPDCPPVKVDVLGENLVAFRDTNGQVGVIDAYCAHRGANLYWGRTEECGLRCVYHGWQYDIHGNCIDMPNEPAGAGFKEKIHVTAYPAREAGGMIWAFLGQAAPGGKAEAATATPLGTSDGVQGQVVQSAPRSIPEMPLLEWTLVPESHRYVHKRFQECNFLQNVEGEVDSSHVSFLHRNTRPRTSSTGRMDGYVPGQQLMSQTADASPVFQVLETDYGLLIGARRDFDAEQYYWRITQFLMPSYTMIPSEPDQPISFTAAIPIDDTHTWGYTVTWHPDRPLRDEEIARIETWTGIYAEVTKPNYRPVLNKANEYLIDRQKQKTESFTGIRGIREQDLAVQEDQRGPITDRTREHLGSSDAAVIAMRRKLLLALQALERDEVVESVRKPAAYRVRSAAVLAPREESLTDVLRGSARAAAGV